LRLASEGARVAANFVSNTEQAEQTIADLKALGVEATAIKGDVSSRDEAQRVVAEARDALGHIDIVVHCAAISIVEHATKVTWETWKQTIDVNLHGTFHVVDAVKDGMIAREYGRIVLLSSIAALRERENQVHYSASKAAVIAMTRCWAQAWAQHNIRINCIWSRSDRHRHGLHACSRSPRTYRCQHSHEATGKARRDRQLGSLSRER
jgi:3-oxoacyl-[acyl-carrier protein] reductase